MTNRHDGAPRSTQPGKPPEQTIGYEHREHCFVNLWSRFAHGEAPYPTAVTAAAIEACEMLRRAVKTFLLDGTAPRYTEERYWEKAILGVEKSEQSSESSSNYSRR